MRQSFMFKYWMMLIATCFLTCPIQTSCFTIPHSVTKTFTSPYGKAACFVVCTYLAMRTIGYLISDPIEEQEEIDSKNKNNQQNTEQINPITLACLASVAAALANNSVNATFNWWNSDSDIPEFTSIKDVAEYQKPIEKLIGSPQEIAIAICKEVIANYKKGNKIPPSNFLLHGLPGTGKSDLAMATALKLFEVIGADALLVTGSIFNTKYSGDGASRVRSLIKEAIKRTQNNTKPVFICIDEIDALGDRDSTDKGSGLSQSQTINELLSQISSTQKKYCIYIVATTNHKEKLDNAVLRRFEEYKVEGLTKEQMEKFIKYEMELYPLDSSISSTHIINLFDDIPIASFIETLFKKALRSATYENRSVITIKDFKKASNGYQAFYDSYDKKEPKIEIEKHAQMLNFIEQIKRVKGKHKISFEEAEIIAKKISGYKGKKMFGKGGCIDSGSLTEAEVWDLKQREYTENQEARANKHLEIALKGDLRADKQYLLNLNTDERAQIQPEIARTNEARALEEDKYREARRKREEEAHERQKEGLKLQIEGLILQASSGESRDWRLRDKLTERKTKLDLDDKTKVETSFWPFW